MFEALNRAGRRKLEKSGEVRRQFNYSLGENGKPGFVNLNFTLRIDIKEELENFTECLEAALVDVKEEIEKHSSK